MRIPNVHSVVLHWVMVVGTFEVRELVVWGSEVVLVSPVFTLVWIIDFALIPSSIPVVGYRSDLFTPGVVGHFVVQFVRIVAISLFFLVDIVMLDTLLLFSLLKLFESFVLELSSQESSDHALVVRVGLDIEWSIVFKLFWLFISLVFPPVVDQFVVLLHRLRAVGSCLPLFGLVASFFPILLLVLLLFVLLGHRLILLLL